MQKDASGFSLDNVDCDSSMPDIEKAVRAFFNAIVLVDEDHFSIRTLPGVHGQLEFLFIGPELVGDSVQAYAYTLKEHQIPERGLDDLRQDILLWLMRAMHSREVQHKMHETYSAAYNAAVSVWERILRSFTRCHADASAFNHLRRVV